MLLSAGGKSSEVLNRGRLVVLLVVFIAIGVGWSLYSTMIAPRWMRDFGLELAAKAKIVSTQPTSTVFSTMKNRAEPESPYICFGNSTTFDWDRVYFAAGTIDETLEGLDWGRSSLEAIRTTMLEDDRYQLIAFSRDDAVVEHGYYFTMWADLSAISRSDGYAPHEAVFVAESDGAIYRVYEAGHAEQWSAPPLKAEGMCRD